MEFIVVIVFISLMALVQVAYYSKRALKKVSYERFFNKTAVFAGEKAELYEIITNNKAAPVPWARIESRIPAALKFKSQDNLNVNMELFHKSLFFLSPYRKITRKHEITCLKRGYFDCRLVSLSAGDLFGLTTARRDVECSSIIYVYPEIKKPSEMPDSAKKWQGELAARRWILPDPILVTGVREYRYGDPQKDVHWKATARSGSLQVKTRDFTVTPRILLVFNTQVSDNLFGLMTQEETDFVEQGVSVCASLAAFCVDHGLDVGFTSNGASGHGDGTLPNVAPACSRSHLEGLFRVMSALVIRMQLGIHTMLDRRMEEGITGMDIAIVSGYWSPTLESRAVELRRLGNTVTHIKFG